MQPRSPGSGRESVRKVVARQAAAGIDIGNDGEQMKDGFFLYLAQRLTGFGGSWQRAPRGDVERYPEFKRMLGRAGRQGRRQCSRAASRKRSAR